MQWRMRPVTRDRWHESTRHSRWSLRWTKTIVLVASFHIRCITTATQGPPSASTRRETARNILTIMSGQSLKDRDMDQRLRNSMHALPTTKLDTRTWDRLAANVRRSGPDAALRALDQKLHPVPSVSGAQDQHCQLTSYPVGRRYKEETQLNTLMADLFEAITAATQTSSLPTIELSRWDLFHAHCFFTPEDKTLGLLFHAKEYPRQSEAFPYNLGYCQRGSPLQYKTREMDFRNLLYFQGELCGLDVGEESVLHNTLIMDGLQDVRTVLEMDFGQAIYDVNFFGSLNVSREERLFVCGNFPGMELEAETI